MKLTCPVCAEKYKTPKVLSCGHTVCCRCLNSHITISVPMQGYDIHEYLSNSNTLRHIPTKTEFTCPVNRCGKQNTPPEPERPTWTWADQFPNNLTIASLIDSSDKNDTGPKNCDFCWEVGKNVVASGFCENCAQALCSRCVYIHRKVRKGHNLETWSQCRLSKDVCDEESNKSADMKSNNWRQQGKCPFHSMELSNSYCQDHKALCCSICKSIDHKSCKVIRVDTLISGDSNNFCSLDLSSRLAACKKNIMELMKDRLDTLDCLEDRKKTILTQVLSLNSLLQELMENLESKLSKKLEVIHNEIKGELEAEMKRFEFLTEIVTGTNTKLQAEIDGQHHTKSIPMFLEVQKECRKIEEEIETTTKKRSVDIQFTVEDQVEKMIKKVRQMEEKGDVLKTSFHLDPGRNFTKTGKYKNTEKQEQSHQYIEKVLEVNAQVPSDTWPCWLTDCVFLDNSELLVVDNANMKIKHFSADYCYMGDLTMSAKPWGIAVSSNDSVQLGAVTLPEACTICIFVTVPHLKLVCECNTPGACYGIGFLSDDSLIVSCENNKKAVLHMFTFNGDKTGLIENGEKFLSGLMHCMPRYLAVTKTNNIYITDAKLYQIKQASLEGNQESQFTDSKFIAPAGITLDHDENIIACGNGSLNVFWISKKINESKQILTNLHLPRAITFHPVENKFVITQDSGKLKSFLQIFMLKEIFSNDTLTLPSMLDNVSS